ncbi:MAG: PriCT-2 domain-containing protein, partial [Halobaculum sp.]
VTEGPEVSPQFEEIPDLLRSRDQWLLWDARNDRPKQPHWNGRFGISWSHPSDWGSWAEARALAEEQESWGVGFVNALNNDDYPTGMIASVDVDGGVEAVHETNDGVRVELADWVPPLDEFRERDVYVEVSPSGTGLRIPVVATGLPEWWTDYEDDPDEHVGLELLANKFSTYTGRRVAGCGHDLAERADWLDEWLSRAYENLSGDTPPPLQQSPEESAERDTPEPDAPDTSSSYDGGEISRETVEDMLSELPDTQHYNEWLRTLFALLAWDDGERGKEVAEQWSRSNEKWEEPESQRTIDDLWQNRTPEEITVGTLVYQAKQADWEPPADWGEEPPEWQQKLVEEGHYDSVADVPDDPTTAVPELSDGTDADGVDAETGGETDSGTRPTPTNPAGDLMYGPDVRESLGVPAARGYGYLSVREGRDGSEIHEWEEATNFMLETLAVIEVDGGQRLRIRVHPETDESPYEVEVHPTVFNETRTFREEVVRGRTTHFENAFGDALGDLRLTVGQQQAPRHTGVAHVGAAQPAHDDSDLPEDAWNEWVTPDGVLTADGWLDDSEGEHTYIARSQSQTGEESIVGEKWSLTPDHDTVDPEHVREVLRRLPRARLPDRALATLSWFYTAPLKPIIFHAENEFPHLSVRGKTESGKTSWLQLLSR